MQVIVDVALPVFAIILTGWAGGRTVLGEEASRALSAFVYWFALPAVLFPSMARQPLGAIFNPSFIGTFLGSMLAVYALGWGIGWRLKPQGQDVHSLQGLNAAFSNTGYMGIPLFITAFGPDRILPALIATVIMSVVMIGLAVIAMEWIRSHGSGLGRSLGRVGLGLLKNPLIISSLAGLAWNLTGWPIPKPALTFCTLMGAAAGPCALFAIGVFLAGRPLDLGLTQVGWLVPLKLLVHPALAWLLTSTLFPMDRFWTGSALLLAALPTGALTFVMASQYKVYEERTSQVILLSTIASIPILSLILMEYAAPG